MLCKYIYLRCVPLGSCLRVSFLSANTLIAHVSRGVRRFAVAKAPGLSHLHHLSFSERGKISTTACLDADFLVDSLLCISYNPSILHLAISWLNPLQKKKQNSIQYLKR